MILNMRFVLPLVWEKWNVDKIWHQYVQSSENRILHFLFRNWLQKECLFDFLFLVWTKIPINCEHVLCVGWNFMILVWTVIKLSFRKCLKLYIFFILEWRIWFESEILPHIYQCRISMFEPWIKQFKKRQMFIKQQRKVLCISWTNISKYFSFPSLFDSIF